MPPETSFRPQRILEILARHRVEHVLIGGYAAMLAGIEILTRDLDISARPDGTDGYHDLRRGARRLPLGGGLHVMVAALEDVIRSKTAAGRAKDLEALPALRAALARQGQNAPQ